VEASWFPYSVINVIAPIVIGTIPISSSVTEVPAIDEEISISSGEIMATNEETTNSLVPKIVVEDTEGKIHDDLVNLPTLQKFLHSSLNADLLNTINNLGDHSNNSPPIYMHHSDRTVRSGRLLVPGRSVDDNNVTPRSEKNSKHKLRKSRSTSTKPKIIDSKFCSPEFKRAFGVDFSEESFAKVGSPTKSSKVDFDRRSHDSRTTAL